MKCLPEQHSIFLVSAWPESFAVLGDSSKGMLGNTLPHVLLRGSCRIILASWLFSLLGLEYRWAWAYLRLALLAQVDFDIGYG